jgi:thiol peroxidase
MSFLRPMFLFMMLSSACTHTAPVASVSKETIQPGTSVVAGGKTVKLKGDGKLAIGTNINDFLKNAGVEAPDLKGKVVVINVVPSIDTKVCEEQTHILGESPNLPSNIARLTISRDLPMAQRRFAAEANLENIQYVSDYKTGGFGNSTGLLMDGSELLARAVIVADRDGIVRYMQVVPDVSKMPDMEKAFTEAKSLQK